MASVLAVFVGGMFGSAIRLGIDTALPHAADSFAWSTLAINVVGSFALGVLTARVWPTAHPWLRAGLGPGVLGAFTTFSAVMVSMVAFTTADRLILGLAYLAASVALGFGAAAVGLQLGRATKSLAVETGTDG